jgi:hypothetical protein
MLSKNLECKFKIIFDRVWRTGTGFLEILRAIISSVKAFC